MQIHDPIDPSPRPLRTDACAASTRIRAEPIRTLLTVALAASLAVGLLATPSGARSGPETWKIVGTLGPPAKGQSSYRALELEDDGRRYQLQAEELRVIRGGRLGAQILDELSRYRPALHLDGPPQILKPLREAAPGSTVEITGYRPAGTRRFMVSNVTVKPPAGNPAGNP